MGGHAVATRTSRAPLRGRPRVVPPTVPNEIARRPVMPTANDCGAMSVVTSEMTIAALLTEYLRQAGVRHVFGYPGESIVDFMEAIRRRVHGRGRGHGLRRDRRVRLHARPRVHGGPERRRERHARPRAATGGIRASRQPARAVLDAP